MITQIRAGYDKYNIWKVFIPAKGANAISMVIAQRHRIYTLLQSATVTRCIQEVLTKDF